MESAIRLGPEEGAEPVFFVYPGLDAPFCHELSAALPDRPLFLLPRQEIDVREPLPSFEELALRHVETIRAARPRGPYVLGSFSAGAALVREMACLLAGRGEETSALLLVADPRLSARLWRAARRAAELPRGLDTVERLHLFNLIGRAGQLCQDAFKPRGVRRVRESLARARHRVQRQGTLWALGPNSRASDDTLKAMLWAWAGHRARSPAASVVRAEAGRNENGMMELVLKSPLLLPSQCSTSPAGSSSARLATPSRSISAT
ncbi:MAG TPA: thioesterase domain-containing protein [Elusimicrobiota bacterium]|nr:thioesterase domain-containing protein [Elusimicrobiota bacterium]